MTFQLHDFLCSGAVMSLSPDKLLLAWGKPHFVDPNHLDSEAPSFYCTDFFLKSSNPWIQYPHDFEVTLQDFKTLLGPRFHLENADWILDQPDQFKTAFHALSDDLQANRLKKGVPYLFSKSSSCMTPERLKNSLQQSLVTLEKKTGYLYGQWNDSDGILGITPELLFTFSHKESKIIKTMAVAGTCHPSQDQEAFFHDEKERYEHQLVVQGICQSLQSLGLINVGSIQLLTLPSLIHLMTPIEIELTGPFQFDSLVHQLHPTPALGAFPKEEGAKWLASFEAHTPRHYFGAPIGFNHPIEGISRCFVAIRNVQWNSEGMRIGAGCGVVIQSTFEKEWNEIQIKIQAIRNQLNL